VKHSALRPSLAFFCYPHGAWAASVTSAKSTYSHSGDVTWMLIATALIFFMTPDLTLFYAGMARAKNFLSVLMQSFVAACLHGVSMYTPNTDYAPAIPLSFAVRPLQFW
jgi:hypothetical protein